MPIRAQPAVSNVDVIAARPDPADRRRLARLSGADDARAEGAAAARAPIFVVKVYLADVGVLETGLGLALYVGDEWVQKYAGFPGGIYFNVYDPAHLARLAGQPIRFTVDHHRFFETGIRVPTPPADPAAGDSARGEGANIDALPTKDEALKA